MRLKAACAVCPPLLCRSAEKGDGQEAREGRQPAGEGAAAAAEAQQAQQAEGAAPMEAEQQAAGTPDAARQQADQAAEQQRQQPGGGDAAPAAAGAAAGSEEGDAAAALAAVAAEAAAGGAKVSPPSAGQAGSAVRQQGGYPEGAMPYPMQASALHGLGRLGRAWSGGATAEDAMPCGCLAVPRMACWAHRHTSPADRSSFRHPTPTSLQYPAPYGYPPYFYPHPAFMYPPHAPSLPPLPKAGAARGGTGDAGHAAAGHAAPDLLPAGSAAGLDLTIRGTNRPFAGARGGSLAAAVEAAGQEQVNILNLPLPEAADMAQVSWAVEAHGRPACELASASA